MVVEGIDGLGGDTFENSGLGLIFVGVIGSDHSSIRSGVSLETSPASSSSSSVGSSFSIMSAADISKGLINNCKRSMLPANISPIASFQEGESHMPMSEGSLLIPATCFLAQCVQFRLHFKFLFPSSPVPIATSSPPIVPPHQCLSHPKIRSPCIRTPTISVNHTSPRSMTEMAKGNCSSTSATPSNSPTPLSSL